MQPKFTKPGRTTRPAQEFYEAVSGPDSRGGRHARGAGEAMTEFTWGTFTVLPMPGKGRRF